MRRYFATFSYRAQSWSKPRRAVPRSSGIRASFTRVGFIVTNMARPAERVVAFYNQRGTAEQHFKVGKYAIKWTRLSCRTFAANAVRLQLHALAYNLGNFMRTLAMPKAAEPWSLTSLREKLIKIGAKVVSHGRYVTFQMAATVTRTAQMFKLPMPRYAAPRPSGLFRYVRPSRRLSGAPGASGSPPPRMAQEEGEHGEDRQYDDGDDVHHQ